MINRCRCGSYAELLQFTPPALPGYTTVPCKLGGVKIPSDREALIRSSHHLRSSSVLPNASLGFNPSGTVEIPDGCVGHASSPGISVFGTATSSTGNSGLPFSRFNTNTRPIFVVIAIAGVLSFHVNSVGCDATS